MTLAKLCYGLFFNVVVPLLLYSWAKHASVDLPLALEQNVALAGAVFGLALCLWSIFTLISLGKGLPMNAFPPERFVERGPYRFFAHPIYVGFCVGLYGIAAYTHAGAAFYLVAPTVVFATAALALGFENFDMQKRFKNLRYEPFVGLVHKDKAVPDRSDKLRFVFGLYVIALFFSMAFLGLHGGAFQTKALLLLLLYSFLVPIHACFIRSYQSLRHAGFFWLIIAGANAWSVNFVQLTFIAIAAFSLPLLAKPAHLGINQLANSWHAWHLGPFRIINHGFYAGFAALCGFVLWDILTKGKALASIFFISIFALFVSAIWGQVLEGAGPLKRPFGYFGAVFGAGIAFLAVSVWDRALFWEICASGTLSFSFAQAVGRVRCLVNGCCHGGLAPSWIGIRIEHPRSRVSRISKLAGKPIFPSQIFSMMLLFIISLVLLTMWQHHASFSLIFGLYFILAGIARFLEEATRGEVQTKTIAGLRIYQWLAVLMLAVGIAITCIKAPFSSAGRDFSVVLEHAWIYLFIAGSFTFAFGIDLPSSEKRFSQL